MKKNYLNLTTPFLTILLLFISNSLIGQACIEFPEGIVARENTLPNGNCEYTIDLCVDVPNSPRPKRIDFLVEYDTDNDGVNDSSQSFSYAPGGQIPSGTYCLSAFSPSQEFIVNDIVCGAIFDASIIGYTNNSGGSGGDCTSFLAPISETQGFNPPLPITLIDFKGETLENKNTISWTIAEEYNNFVQIVEKAPSPTGDFTEVGKIYSEGDFTGIQNFTIDDSAPLDISYYRLKSVDLDGKIDYSELIVLEREGDNLEIVNIYPVPVSNSLYLKYKSFKSGEVTISLLNNIGLQIQKSTWNASKGINAGQIDMTDTPPGPYFLIIDDGVRRQQKTIVKINL